jgi:sodium-dependent phosphate cotransporter
MTAKANNLLGHIAKAAIALGLLYAFLFSIELLSSGFQLLGKERGVELLSRATNNPLMGLIIGVLVTSIIQSSSCTTSIVVTLVTGGMLSLPNAVPIVMGANIGTTITNTLVSLGNMSRREEFKRAMSAAIVHDMFNILCVAIFLPLELATGYLQHAAKWLAEAFAKAGGLEYISPKVAVELPAKALCMFAGGALPATTGAIVVIVAALALLFAALIFMVKVMRSAALAKFEVLFDRYVGRYPLLALALGIVVTGIIQSSSITTSLMVPLVGAGILAVEQIYPVMLGANIGTTVTAVLAALAIGKVEGLTIAFVHFLFNCSGTILFFFIPGTKRLPIGLAKWLAGVITVRRIYAFLFIFGVFFFIPGVIILIQRLLGAW